MNSQNERTVVLVLGPPRSGTSVVCNVLSQVGIDFGDPALFVDPDTNSHNPMFFEIEELNGINDEIMHALGWKFRDFTALPLDEDFTPELIAAFHERIRSFMQAHFPESTYIGLKDPRFCFTLPVWSAVLGTLGFRIRNLLTLRDADAVAASNYRLNPDLGLRHAHRIQPLSIGAAKYFLGAMPYAQVSFEALTEQAPEAIEALARISGASLENIRVAAGDVFDPSCVHWKSKETQRQEDTFFAEYAQFASTSRRLDLQAIERDAAGADSNQQPIALGGIESPMLASSGETVQLYHRLAMQAHDEERSQLVVWPMGQDVATIRFESKTPLSCEFIRLDFSEHAGIYRLAAFRVDGVSMSPRACAVAINGAFIPTQETDDVIVIANHSDPWVELRIGERSISQCEFEIERVGFSRAYQQMFRAPQVDQYIQRLEASINGVMMNVMHVENSVDSSFKRIESQMQRLSTDHDVSKAEQAAMQEQAFASLSERLEALHLKHDRKGFVAWVRRTFLGETGARSAR